MFQLVIILILFLGAGGFGAYSWVKTLRAENQILQANQVVLEGAVSQQEEVIANQKKEFEFIQEANNGLREEQTKLLKDVKKLSDKLGKHELDILAQNKPGLVTKIITNASKNEMRCFEIVSGSEHTESELAATKKSQTNGECAEIANPNFGKETS